MPKAAGMRPGVLCQLPNSFFFWLGISCRDLEGVVRAWGALWGAPHVPHRGGDTQGGTQPHVLPPGLSPSESARGRVVGTGLGKANQKGRKVGRKKKQAVHTPRETPARVLKLFLPGS